MRGTARHLIFAPFFPRMHETFPERWQRSVNSSGSLFTAISIDRRISKGTRGTTSAMRAAILAVEC